MLQNNLMKIALVDQGHVARRTDNVFTVVGNSSRFILEKIRSGGSPIECQFCSGWYVFECGRGMSRTAAERALR